MLLNKILKRILTMCPEAWYIFISSVKLGCLLCLCSLAMLLSAEGSLIQNYQLYMTGISLIELSQSVLLIGVIASVCMEAIQS